MIETLCRVLRPLRTTRAAGLRGPDSTHKRAVREVPVIYRFATTPDGLGLEGRRPETAGRGAERDLPCSCQRSTSLASRQVVTCLEPQWHRTEAASSTACNLRPDQLSPLDSGRIGDVYTAQLDTLRRLSYLETVPKSPT